MPLQATFAKSEGEPSQTEPRRLIAEGTYQALIGDAEARLSRSGNPMIVLNYIIKGDEAGETCDFTTRKKYGYLNFVTERQQRESVETLRSLLGEGFTQVASDEGGKISVNLEQAADMLNLQVGSVCLIEISHSEKDGEVSDWANNARKLETNPF